MKKACFLILPFLLNSCAGSAPDVEHTVVIVGSSSATLHIEEEPTEMERHQIKLAAGDSPETLSVTAKELWVSENADCSDLEQVRRLGSSGLESEIYTATANDIISARPVSADIYQCVAVVITDQVTFKPNAQSQTNYAGCEAQEYTVDIYETGSNTYKDLDGNDVTPADDTEQELTFVISTGTPSALTLHADQIFTMSSELNVNAPFDIYLFADYDDDVDDSDSCTLNSGTEIGLRE